MGISYFLIFTLFNIRVLFIERKNCLKTMNMTMFYISISLCFVKQWVEESFTWENPLNIPLYFLLWFPPAYFSTTKKSFPIIEIFHQIICSKCFFLYWQGREGHGIAAIENVKFGTWLVSISIPLCSTLSSVGELKSEQLITL